MMFFGLFNTPASFQKYINKTLVKNPTIFIIKYLNVIFNYIKALNQVLKKPFEFLVLFKKIILDYIILVQNIKIKHEQIKGVKN